ncbi:SUR7/PalI family-domain-containing protein [Annulohypoxylon maeteangense]|uniref:SUR7/PalI family-domain-containing protein n=1 Tax=Annulohypoxylon maeteangense TaxID=1927788 RepID=UPI002007822C|nr:SUR7/PalI family-domain-containing protein [Annulohypoxylon maeteangense]KAI0882174.1 SUR7/PalI family-domain-containing protein [Annulohypoxylon maeteangense]
MGVGRYICVALPFILTVGSIICFLIAGLTGVANNNLYIFQIDMRNVSVDASTLSSLLSNISNLENITSTISKEISSRSPAPEPVDVSSIVSSITGTGSGSNGNITAADLGIDKLYDVTLWNYCTVSANGTDKNCTQAKFNWAETDFNTTFVNDFGSDLGANITIPQEIQDALNTFKPLMKWTEVVYIIAMVALGLELVVGLFTACSRLVSCLTWLISGIATLAVIAVSAMMTAMAVVVVGAVKGAIGKYGGDASWNGSFLACIWIGVAFALGASLFWLFSICCCAPERRPYAGRSRGGPEGEKFIPTGSYAPLGEQRNSGYNYGAPQRGGARSDLAYEPYSHAR